MNAQVRIGGTTDPNENAVLDLNPDAGNASGGLLLPQVTLSAPGTYSPLTAHVKGMVVYHVQGADGEGSGMVEGIYFNDGQSWQYVYSQAPASTEVIPLIFTKQPGFAWLGADGATTPENLSVTMAPVDNVTFTYQWYERDPETLDATLIPGATAHELTIKKQGTDGTAIIELENEGEIRQFFCIVISSARYAISNIGYAVYGLGVRIANNGWLKVANANLGADPSLTVEQQMAYSPTLTPTYPTSTTVTDPAYDPTVYGDWYQWGRRKDGHQDRTTPASGTYAGILADFEGLDVSYLNSAGQIHNDYSSGIQNQFIQRNNPAVAPNPVSAQDWRQYPGDGNTATSPANDWTWRNPANDPCQEELGGSWRVPTQSEWAQIVSNNAWSYQPGATEDQIKGYAIRPGSSSKIALFLPAAGYRSRNGGAPGSVSANGYYWSSAPAGTNSYTLYFAGSGTPNASYTSNRSHGLTVRCVAE
jgi:uncharacterized protein (TIGR02145 family)